MIRFTDLADPQVLDLIAFHQRTMQQGSPPGQSFALDVSGLQADDVTVWAAYSGTQVAAIGALKRLDNISGEIKSMRTHPDFLRRGMAGAILEAIIDHARGEGLCRLSLETGSGPAFEPALALYRRRGFINGPAFGTYELTDFNQCLHMDLT